MRGLIAGSVIILLVLPAAAEAEGHWTGAAWYEVADTIIGPFVWSGPYATEDECKVRLTPREYDAEYSCQYLGEKPSWDV